MTHPVLQYFFAHMHVIGILALALAPALALLAAPGRSVILDNIFIEKQWIDWTAKREPWYCRMGFEAKATVLSQKPQISWVFDKWWVYRSQHTLCLASIERSLW